MLLVSIPYHSETPFGRALREKSAGIGENGSITMADAAEHELAATLSICVPVVHTEYDTRADDATTRTRTIALVSTNTRDATRDETMGAEAVSAAN